MLYHHDDRSYTEAASDAARVARAKMEDIITRGQANAQAVLDKVLGEVPNDRIVGGNALDFQPGPDGVHMLVAGAPNALHPHALSQVAERGAIPLAYVKHLDQAGEWGRNLLAHNFREVYANNGASARRYLVRNIGDQTRGFLSDRFRRLDSRPILESFCHAAQQLGAVPVEGYALDTKIALKALLPMVFEPVPNEVMCFGMVLENSDFGDGALAVRAFMMRLWCTNYAITEDAMRKVHIGGRLSDDFQYSQRTYELDTEATASAIQDVTRGLLGPGRVEDTCAAIRSAHEQEVKPQEVKAFLKRHLTKGEAEQASDAFSSADVVNMPAGQSRWRLSNAISWIAGQTNDKARALELMKVAGAAIEGVR